MWTFVQILLFCKELKNKIIKNDENGLYEFNMCEPFKQINPRLQLLYNQQLLLISIAFFLYLRYQFPLKLEFKTSGDRLHKNLVACELVVCNPRPLSWTFMSSDDHKYFPYKISNLDVFIFQYIKKQIPEIKKWNCFKTVYFWDWFYILIIFGSHCVRVVCTKCPAHDIIFSEKIACPSYTYRKVYILWNKKIAIFSEI